MLEILAFGGVDVLISDIDSIAGTTITGISLVVETPTTGNEVAGDASSSNTKMAN